MGRTGTDPTSMYCVSRVIEAERAQSQNFGSRKIDEETWRVGLSRIEI